MLIRLETLNAINQNDEQCDTLRKRFSQIYRLYALQKMSIKKYKTLDLNNQQIQNSETQIEGIYEQREILLKKIKSKQRFFGRAWQFTKNILLIPTAAFIVGYYANRL